MIYAMIFFVCLITGVIVGMKIAMIVLVSADKKERNAFERVLDHLIVKPMKDR